MPKVVLVFVKSVIHRLSRSIDSLTEVTAGENPLAMRASSYAMIRCAGESLAQVSGGTGTSLPRAASVDGATVLHF